MDFLPFFSGGLAFPKLNFFEQIWKISQYDSKNSLKVWNVSKEIIRFGRARLPIGFRKLSGTTSLDVATLSTWFSYLAWWGTQWEQKLWRFGSFQFYRSNAWLALAYFAPHSFWLSATVQLCCFAFYLLFPLFLYSVISKLKTQHNSHFPGYLLFKLWLKWGFENEVGTGVPWVCSLLALCHALSVSPIDNHLALATCQFDWSCNTQRQRNG